MPTSIEVPNRHRDKTILCLTIVCLRIVNSHRRRRGVMPVYPRAVFQKEPCAGEISVFLTRFGWGGFFFPKRIPITTRAQ